MKKAEEHYNSLVGKNNVQWIDSKHFKRTLKQKLNKDWETLIKMINLCGDWNPKTDQKLDELEGLINNTHKGEKVIVFTQYSDTANYVYHQLKKRGLTQIDKRKGGFGICLAHRHHHSRMERFHNQVPLLNFL